MTKRELLPLRVPVLYAVCTAFIAIAVTAMFGRAALGAESSVTEPIFGLYYDPSRVHFNSLPTRDLLPTCKRLLLEYKPLPKSLTLYAKSEAGSVHMYIAGARDILGLYVVRDGVCDSDVPILALLKKNHVPPVNSRTPLLSDDEIAALFKDALIRYAKAFGGKSMFLQWLDSLTDKMRSGCEGKPELSCPPTYHLLLPQQQQQLEEYRRD